MPNFFSFSISPLAGETEERDLHADGGIGLTANTRGQCTLQKPVLRFLSCLAFGLLVLTLLCVPNLQVNERTRRSRSKNQLRPQWPAETWKQVRVGHIERAFLCPTKNWYLLQTVCTNSVVLQEQNDGAEWAENQGQKTRVLFREVGREKSPRRGYKGGRGVKVDRERKGELITLPKSYPFVLTHTSHVPQIPSIRDSALAEPTSPLQPTATTADSYGREHSREEIPNRRRRLLQLGRGLLQERRSTTFQWYPRRPPTALELLRANYSNPEVSPIRDNQRPRSRAVNVDLGLSFGTHERGEQ